MDSTEIDLENIKITNQHGSDALKYLFLLNGSSSIAFLTFLGTIAINPTNSGIETSAVAGLLFYFSVGVGVGVGVCALANCLNYMNLLFFGLGLYKIRVAFLVATIFCGGISLGLFFVGVWRASVVFGTP